MSPADLRAQIARQRRRLYELGAIVGVHPTRLGEMLNERRPMPPDLAVRIAIALAATDGAERRAGAR